MGKEDYKDYEEFLNKSSNFRILYLLFISNCKSSFENFIFGLNINDKEVYEFSIKLNRYRGFYLIKRILREDYLIRNVDLWNCFNVRELYNLLNMFMEDIRNCGMLDNSLSMIYKKLQDNFEIVKNNYLLSVDDIMNNLSDPFYNNNFLKQVLLRLEDEEDIITNYIYGQEQIDFNQISISSSDRQKIQVEFYIEYIKRIIRYRTLNQEDVKKYFNPLFLEKFDKKLFQDIKSLSLDDLNNLYEYSLDKDININELFKNKISLCLFLEDVLSATNLDLDKLKSKHFIESKSYSSTIFVSFREDSINSLLFIREFILKCIDSGISYNIERSNYRGKDNYTIYVDNISVLSKTINILDSIYEEHTSWFIDNRLPLLCGGLLDDSYYSVGCCGRVSNYLTNYLGEEYLTINNTYQEYLDEMIREAYKKYREQLINIVNLSEDEKINYFRNILVNVKSNFNKKDIKVIHSSVLSDNNSLMVKCVYDVINGKRNVKIHKNGCCNIINDCYILMENDYLELLDKLFAKRCLD